MEEKHSMQNNKGGLSSSSSSSLEDLDHPRVERSGYQSQEAMPKKEENPFSFKHFLKKDSNYSHAGARPKVYSSRVNSLATNPVTADSVVTETDGIYARNPTELPDFVQDHLVIEQCYLNHQDAASGTQMIADIDNLPDFALNSVESRPLRHRNEQHSVKKHDTVGDLPFDLTTGNDKRNLDGYRNLNHGSPDRETIREPMNFPLDLPFAGPSSDQGNSVQINSNESIHSLGGDNGIPKSLPDFLNDGPIRNRVPLPDNTGNHIESSHPPLQMEIEMLRHNLEIARRQNSEKNRRIQMLEAELASRRAVDYEETAHLEKAMEQVEDNLKRSTRRAVNAESAVTQLKQQIKELTAEISVLRIENRELKNVMGAGCSFTSRDGDKKVLKLAGDLREAASSAESYLRQLMSGVDNLKIIASTLENLDRIEDRTKDLLPDFDEDNAAGPAL
ncbi:GSCOCG00002915001-RA-CDS [Cotesia congregata]|nr:GSCOCG00002915001-RA-CDS [Cotesia congregata]